MSEQYDEYLVKHKLGVRKAYEWLCRNCSELIVEDPVYEIVTHDESKSKGDEYQAYDEYFYGKNKTFDVIEDFNKAWLLHIHRNPHHWQHWVLLEDDPEGKESYICIEMPERYVIEMICDWWSFSINKGEIKEIFDWYDEHKKKMKLHEKTRAYVEKVLDEMKKRIEEEEKIRSNTIFLSPKS